MFFLPDGSAQPSHFCAIITDAEYGPGPTFKTLEALVEIISLPFLHKSQLFSLEFLILSKNLLLKKSSITQKERIKELIEQAMMTHERFLILRPLINSARSIESSVIIKISDLVDFQISEKPVFFISGYLIQDHIDYIMSKIFSTHNVQNGSVFWYHSSIFNESYLAVKKNNNIKSKLFPSFLDISAETSHGISVFYNRVVRSPVLKFNTIYINNPSVWFYYLPKLLYFLLRIFSDEKKAKRIEVNKIVLVWEEPYTKVFLQTMKSLLEKEKEKKNSSGVLLLWFCQAVLEKVTFVKSIDLKSALKPGNIVVSEGDGTLTDALTLGAVAFEVLIPGLMEKYGFVCPKLFNSELGALNFEMKTNLYLEMLKEISPYYTCRASYSDMINILHIRPADEEMLRLLTKPETNEFEHMESKCDQMEIMLYHLIKYFASSQLEIRRTLNKPKGYLPYFSEYTALNPYLTPKELFWDKWHIRSANKVSALQKIIKIIKEQCILKKGNEAEVILITKQVVIDLERGICPKKQDYFYYLLYYSSEFHYLFEKRLPFDRCVRTHSVLSLLKELELIYIQ